MLVASTMLMMAVGLLVEDEVPGDDLLLGVGPEGVDARQVHHRAVLLPPDLTGLLVHRDAGEVAHVLVGAGEGVEEGGLAAVLIAGQCKDHSAATSTSIWLASSSPQGQLVAPDLDLDGVSHGGDLL